MSHGVITLIITGCDQYPGNCWIAVPFLGDSFQQFNDITNVPTFFFWSLAPPYEVVAFVLKSADYSLVLWHLFLFHYNSFTIVWFTVFNIRYSFNPFHRVTWYDKVPYWILLLNHRGILFVLFFDSPEEFSIQFSFKPSQYFFCLKKHIGSFLNVLV